MTDKEMQALAAQAAGLKVKTWWEKYPGEWWADLDCERQPNDPPTVWSSLHDDGDALRLATRLCMSVSTGPCQATANTIDGALSGDFCTETTIGQDHAAAVRRAITRAAAALAVSDLAKREGAE